MTVPPQMTPRDKLVTDRTASLASELKTAVEDFGPRWAAREAALGPSGVKLWRERLLTKGPLALLSRKVWLHRKL